MIASRLGEKDLGVMADEKVNMSLLCALGAQKIKQNPGLHQKEHGQQVTGDSAPWLLGNPT